MYDDLKMKKPFGLYGLYKIIQRCNPMGTRRCCDVESTSLTLIQRRNNVVCQVGMVNVSCLLCH